MHDEGPSSEDLDRFGDDTARCPDCGAQVWDQAEVCPKCHAYIGGNTTTKMPIESWIHKRWAMLIIIALLIAFGLLWMWSRPAGY